MKHELQCQRLTKCLQRMKEKTNGGNLSYLGQIIYMMQFLNWRCGRSCQICIVQIKPRKHVRDDADYTHPIRQYELLQIIPDREQICLEIYLVQIIKWEAMISPRFETCQICRNQHPFCFPLLPLLPFPHTPILCAHRWREVRWATRTCRMPHPQPLSLIHI